MASYIQIFVKFLKRIYQVRAWAYLTVFKIQLKVCLLHDEYQYVYNWTWHCEYLSVFSTNLENTDQKNSEYGHVSRSVTY